MPLFSLAQNDSEKRKQQALLVPHDRAGGEIAWQLLRQAQDNLVSLLVIGMAAKACVIEKAQSAEGVEAKLDDEFTEEKFEALHQQLNLSIDLAGAQCTSARQESVYSEDDINKLADEARDFGVLVLECAAPEQLELAARALAVTWLVIDAQAITEQRIKAIQEAKHQNSQLRVFTFYPHLLRQLGDNEVQAELAKDPRDQYYFDLMENRQRILTKLQQDGIYWGEKRHHVMYAGSYSGDNNPNYEQEAKWVLNAAARTVVTAYQDYTSTMQIGSRSFKEWYQQSDQPVFHICLHPTEINQSGLEEMKKADWLPESLDRTVRRQLPEYQWLDQVLSSALKSKYELAKNEEIIRDCILSSGVIFIIPKVIASTAEVACSSTIIMTQISSMGPKFIEIYRKQTGFPRAVAYATNTFDLTHDPFVQSEAIAHQNTETDTHFWLQQILREPAEPLLPADLEDSQTDTVDLAEELQTSLQM